MEAFAVGGVVAWGVTAALKVHPKLQYVLLALVGAFAAGGFLGQWLSRLGAWMETASSSSTSALLGVGIGWAITYTIALWWGLVMFPNKVEPAGTATGKQAPKFSDWIHTTTLVASLFAWPSIVITFVAMRDAVSSGNAGLIWTMVAVIGLTTWIIFALLKVHPKAQYVVLAAFGLGVTGGVLGSWIGTAATWLGTGAEAGSEAIIGVSVGWALALGIVLWWGLVMWPNKVEPAGTATSKEAPPWGDWIHVTTLLVSPLVASSVVLVVAAAGAALNAMGS